MQRRELNDQVTYIEQLGGDEGPIVLINEFNMAPDDTERFIEAWADDAAYMKLQPGFVSTQLHRGTTGSTTFVNVAVWESARALGRAFSSPEFQARIARYPESRRRAARIYEGCRLRHMRWLGTHQLC